MKPLLLLTICFCALNLIPWSVFAQPAPRQKVQAVNIRGFITGVKQEKDDLQSVTTFDLKESKTGEMIKVVLKEKAGADEISDLKSYRHQYVVVNNVPFNYRKMKQILLTNKSELNFLKQSPESDDDEPK